MYFYLFEDFQKIEEFRNNRIEEILSYIYNYMDNIQKYRKFIKDHQDKIDKANKLIIEYVKSKIIPGIQDILDTYEDNYESLTLSVVDGDGDDLDIKYFNDPDEFTLNINFIYNDNDSDNNELYEKINERILSEFGDDIRLIDLEFDFISYHIS